MILAEMAQSYESVYPTFQYPPLVEPFSLLSQHQDDRMDDSGNNRTKKNSRSPFELWTPWKDICTTNAGSDAIIFSRFCVTLSEDPALKDLHQRRRKGNKNFNFDIISRNTRAIEYNIKESLQRLESKVYNKQYSQTKSLQSQRRHHLVRNTCHHICPICHKVFLQKSSVTTHIRIHTGEKPFQCSECKRAFGDYSTYTKHLRTHTGAKPYECHFCLKGFSQSGNLIRHLKRHENCK